MLSKQKKCGPEFFHAQVSSQVEVSRIMEGLVSPFRLVLAFDNRLI